MLQWWLLLKTHNIIQRSDFSSKAVGKIIAEAEAKKTFASAVPRYFFCQHKQISIFALAIPSAVFRSYFCNFVLIKFCWVLSKQIMKLIMLWTNGTKEAIRLRGLKKLILRNNEKSSEMHYRLIVINGVYVTRHVTHPIIY